MIEKVVGAMGVQAIISLMLVGTCVFLWATLQPVPDELLLLTGTVVAHWLGRKGVETGFQAANPPLAPVYIPAEK
jgi:hypothetical protein